MIYTILGLLSAGGLIFAFYAHSNVKRTYIQYSQVPSKKGITGKRLTKAFLKEFGAENVGVEEIGGMLTDHYDPRKRVIRLSKEVFSGKSLAAIGIAAHESGHAVQHIQEYLPFRIRARMAPIIKTLSLASIPIGLIGFMFEPMLIDITALFLITFILFYTVTLPVEFDASSRALALLENKHYLDEEELKKINKVLMAAAFTYVAGTLLLILRFISLFLSRKR